MIERPTVLILGAGASAHLGYPTGRGLIDRICGSIAKFGCHHAIRRRWSDDELQDFSLRLGRSGHASVDAFLEVHPDDTELGRLLIADVLVKHEDEDKLFPPSHAGWYEYLFERMYVDPAGEFFSNSVTIVTFNYDRSLEAFLTQRIKYRYQLDDRQALAFAGGIPIIHTYGFLGAYPDFPYSPQCDDDALQERAAGIRIMADYGPSPVDAFRDAKPHLEEAEAIYFLGFGFHPDNMDRFEFFSEKNLNEKTVFSTCMVSHIEKDKLIDGVARYGLTSASFPAYADCNGFFRRVAAL